jgi:hypothetical protein
LSNRKNHIETLQLSVQEYNKKLLEIDESKTISNLFYERDTLLCKIIEECKPPYYIRHKLFNYRAILLYFIENFNNDISIYIPKFGKKINIITTTDNLFHLLNIPNKKGYLQKERIHSQIIYDRLEFCNHGAYSHHFKPKIASIGWVKETLKEPDFIYDSHANISKKLNFDFLFVREVGKGTKTEPYMYHLVAIKKRHNSASYVINSQFPIEKDKEYSFGENKVSRLHTFVNCDKTIFQKEGMLLPKSKNNLSVNDLMSKFR